MQVGLYAVMVVAALYVEPETATDIVEYKHDAVFVAYPAYFFIPVFVGKFVVGKYGMRIRRGYKAGYLALVGFYYAFEILYIVKGAVKVVANVLGDNAAVAEFLRPGSNAVITALYHKYFLSGGCLPCYHDRV